MGSSDGLDLALLKVKIDRQALLLAEGACHDFEIKGFRHFKNSDHLLEPIECKLDTKVEFRPKNGGTVLGWKLNVDVTDTVEKGYSGSPLICKESGKVLAVVSNRKGNRDGFAISIGHHRDIWEEMPKELISYSVYEVKKQKSIDEKLQESDTPAMVKDIWWYIKAIKEYPFVSILVIFLVLIYGSKDWIYSNYVDVQKVDEKKKSKNNVLLKENNSTNSTIELHNDSTNPSLTKEIELIENNTKNSTIKVFQ
jgi:hypothetical protein